MIIIDNELYCVLFLIFFAFILKVTTLQIINKKLIFAGISLLILISALSD